MRRFSIAMVSTFAVALSGLASAYNCTAASAAEPAAEEVDQASKSLDAFFIAYDSAVLEKSPETKAYRGIRDEDYGKWNDPSDAAAAAKEALLQDAAARMRAQYDPADLSAEDALSHRLFEKTAERSASLHPYREYEYLFDHRRGEHTGIPAFLINIHRVANAEDARAYVERIAGIGPHLDVLAAEARERADNGVMPPDWVYPYVIADLEALIAAGDDNAVLVDLVGKLDKLEIDDSIRQGIKGDARDAWRGSAIPVYQRLLTEMKRQQAIAPTDDGIWRLPDGDKYYAALLRSYTTTDLTADEIHAIGLREVERIHGQMRAIMKQVGFAGSLQDFFEYTRTDDRFFHDTREAYLADAEARLDAMEAKLPDFFGTLPESPLVIKPVEEFREKSAGKAFYQSPAADGSRPGTYYVNLYNLNDMSKNELEALAYHEGLPGHHLQRALQTELGDLPPFRRFGGFTAYTEGWGLYTEELGKDMGFYEDPYSDFGRLGMELWRACRLVVDTGIHSKRWSREQAIQYLAETTPNPEGDIVKAIERYVTPPGQATAYMIGKLKIMELRTRSMDDMGDEFDWRGFHDAVLLSGPVPLEILEENVEQWIATKKGG